MCLPGVEGVGGEVDGVEGRPEVVEEQVQLEVKLDRGNAHVFGLRPPFINSAPQRTLEWLPLDLGVAFSSSIGSGSAQPTLLKQAWLAKVRLNSRKTTTIRKRYISRFVFCFSLNNTPLRKYFTMQTSTMSYNYH